MLPTIWYKILSDLLENKTRSLLVILSILIGVFAVGLVVNSQYILSRDMNVSYQATNPSSAILVVIPPFDEDFILEMERIPEVRFAEGRRSVLLRFQSGINEWQTIEVFAIPDFEDISVNQVKPVSGPWPPPERQLLIERASLNFINANIGDSLTIRTGEGLERTIPVAGVAYDINQVSAEIRGRAYGYITVETLEWLGLTKEFEQLHIIVEGNNTNKNHIENVVEIVQERIEKGGKTVPAAFIPPDPGQHPEISVVQAILFILGVLGVASLFLSAFLVINTITAVVTQQVRQIGIMKAIGAGTLQIMGMYVIMIVVFSFISLTLAIPLSVYASRLATGYVAGLINFNITTFSFPIEIFLLQVAVGLLVPLLAASYPVFSGARITIREAITSYGLGEGQPFGSNLFDKIVQNVRFVSRPILISLRNTFRRKGRFILTLITLSLGGALFIAVFSVRASTILTMSEAEKYWLYDIEIRLQDQQYSERVKDVVSNLPGIVSSEEWSVERGRRVRADGREGNNFIVVGAPAESELFQPTLIAGRWLNANDEKALVINSLLFKFEADLNVGDEITLKINRKESTWQIVGITDGPLTEPTAYANYPHFAKVIRNVERANSIRIITKEHTPEFQAKVNVLLEQSLPNASLDILQIETTSTKREQLNSEFTPIIIFLAIMAILLAVVGGVGLIGTMSINVLERVREIGVMRAIGASNKTIRSIVVIEGVVIGIISWFIASLLALPISRFISDQVGLALLERPLNYTFPLSGLLLWLAFVTILATLATLLPAYRASQISVRESLMYQ